MLSLKIVSIIFLTQTQGRINFHTGVRLIKYSRQADSLWHRAQMIWHIVNTLLVTPLANSRYSQVLQLCV